MARGVELTRYGEALARRARTIFLELREAAREINELKTGSGGSVSLGSVTGPALNLAVPAIRQVSTAYPGIEINIQIENSNVLTRELLAARHDFVVGRIPDDLNPRLFNLVEIGYEEVCLIVRDGHPLLDKAPLPAPHDLPGLRLGVPAAGNAAAPRRRRQLRCPPASAPAGDRHQHLVDHPDAVDRAEHQCDCSGCARRRQT